MELIPDALVILDQNLKKLPQSEPWRRLQTHEQKHLAEKDWDEVIFEHADVIGSALRNAGILGQQSKLLPLGPQFERVDVLFAEVEDDDSNELIRLVLVEDKLVSNPKARREVLAQIVEYGAKARNWQITALSDKFSERRGWLNENAAKLRKTLHDRLCRLE